jgi:hypothetical protein
VCCLGRGCRLELSTVYARILYLRERGDDASAYKLAVAAAGRLQSSHVANQSATFKKIFPDAYAGKSGRVSNEALLQEKMVRRRLATRPATDISVCCAPEQTACTAV